MENILFINGCVGKNSRTHYLAQEVINNLKGQVAEINLEKENIKPLNSCSLNKRNDYLAQNDYSREEFKYAREFANADYIVVAAPYWDLSFPAMVKIYFEAISVVGITFSYNENGVPQGLCKGKKLIYVTTAGGVIGEFNFGFDYVKALCVNLYGIKNVEFFKAENLDIEGVDVEMKLKCAKEEINENFH